MGRTRTAGGLLILRQVGHKRPIVIRAADVVELQPCEPVGPYADCSQVWTHRAGWMRVTAPYALILDALQRLGHAVADLSAEAPASGKRPRGRRMKTA